MVSYIVQPRNLEHGFRMISARMPYIYFKPSEDDNVPTFRLLLQGPGGAMLLHGAEELQWGSQILSTT